MFRFIKGKTHASCAIALPKKQHDKQQILRENKNNFRFIRIAPTGRVSYSQRLTVVARYRRGQWSCCQLLLLMLSSLLILLLLLLQQLHFPHRCIMDLRKFPLDSQVGSSHQKLLKISALTILISFWIKSVSQALFPFQDKISLPASFYPSFETYNSYFSHFWKIQVIFTKFSIYSISIYF